MLRTQIKNMQNITLKQIDGLNSPIIKITTEKRHRNRKGES